MSRTPAPPVGEVTPALLRESPLPGPSGGKEGRGRVVVVGGSVETPGAVLLAGEATLRVGAGKLQVATVESVARQLALGLPEALVRGLAETPAGAVAAISAASIADLVADAGALLIGPGLADVEETRALMANLLPAVRCPLVVDALALVAVTEDDKCLHDLDGRVVLTPSRSELRETLRESFDDDDEEAALAGAAELARRSRAVVSVGGATSYVVTPEGKAWSDRSGGAGLGVSGSGDVRAGVVAGLLARGAQPAQAAIWASHVHGRSGERLASTTGRVGFLGRDMLAQLPAVLAELEQ
jgi:ADP-dependent NAD(P)H-hydrate dehydratase